MVYFLTLNWLCLLSVCLLNSDCTLHLGSEANRFQNLTLSSLEATSGFCWFIKFVTLPLIVHFFFCWSTFGALATESEDLLYNYEDALDLVLGCCREGGCNTSGVCHQLRNGFELKHDMLSDDEGVKIKSTRVSSNLNLDNTPLLTYGPLLRLCRSNVKHSYFMYITLTCIHLDQWKSFMKFGIKKSHKIISYNLSWILY